jgi:hypothetical protein
MDLTTLAQRSPRALPSLKPFHVQRHHDLHGNTGTGIVAEGVILSSGKCVLQWLGKVASVSVFDSIEEVISIHGHDGKTVVVMGCDGCPIISSSCEHCAAA